MNVWLHINALMQSLQSAACLLVGIPPRASLRLGSKRSLIMSHRGGSSAAPLTPPALCFSDCLTEVTACNLFTGHEVPLVISRREAFDGYLDTVIGELSVGGFRHCLELAAGQKESHLYSAHRADVIKEHIKGELFSSAGEAAFSFCCEKMLPEQLFHFKNRPFTGEINGFLCHREVKLELRALLVTTLVYRASVAWSCCGCVRQVSQTAVRKNCPSPEL